MRTARVVVSTDVTEWTTQQRDDLFEAIARIEAAQAPVPSDVDLSNVETSGWTLDAYHEAMRRLLGKHGVQASVINDAIKNGTGYLDRDAVYELGNYPQTRSLKGFTRPVNRIQQALIDEGLLPEEADDLLTPDYDLTIKAYQRARGFQVPLEVVKLLHDHNRGKADGVK